MNTNANWLRPCLVLGTGFHRWVLGESMQADFRPLLDWNQLLLTVARELHLPLDRTEHSLSLHWEQLLTIARRSRGFEARPDGRPTLGQLELIAKKSASAILKNLKAAYPADTLNAHFPLQTTWGAVVSLNFDAHWLAGAAPSWSSASKDDGDLTSVMGSGKSLKSELLRVNNHINLLSNDSIARRLWFPNGYLGSAQSLRLGLREFGFQPVAIHEAFEAVKKYERLAGNFEQRSACVKEVLEGRSTLSRFMEGEPKLPLTWVTEMLYRPVCFAGAGMSDAELGLWWLMVQRARNLSGISPTHSPPAAILVKDDDPRLSFWRTEPAGIKPLICSTWQEGWQQVDAWGNKVVAGMS